MTLPTRPRLARLAALGAAGAVAAATLSVPGAAQAAGIDPQPGGAAAGWLRANLPGTVTPAIVPDALEAALGLRVAGDTTTSTQLLAAAATTSGGYTGTTDTDAEPDPTAMTAWYVQQLQGNARAYGTSGDLVARLEGLVDTTGRLGKGLSALTTPTVAGQALAVGALAGAGSTETTAAATYLAGLQCAAGYFNDALPAAAPAPQSCNGAAGAQSVTATALFLLATRTVPGLDTQRTAAVGWLLASQQNNGRWAAAGGGATGDTRATALAAYALSQSNRPGAAAQGAIWLRGIQLANAGQCVTFPASDVGAVAPDGGAYTGVGAQQAAFRLATSRALLVLGLTPGGQAVTDNVLTLPRFARPGATLTATVRTAPRNLLCATAGSGATPVLAATRVLGAYDGGADFSFPAGPEGVTTASITDPTGQVDTASTTVLGPKKLAFSFKKKKVRAGKKAVVKVRGLAAGETVRVSFRGTPKVVTVANGSGEAKVRFKVKGKRGKAKVTVTGQFDDRTRTKKVIVTRR